MPKTLESREFAVKQDELFDRIKRGPTFLFLGQEYLRLETGTDQFLTAVLNKYGKSGKEPLHYNQILEGEAKASPEEALAWMQERCRHLPAPQWLEKVASFSWNGVYTTAIDVIWPKIFRSEWREIEPILEEKDRPSDPRNRFNLHSTFLFGRVDQTDANKRPPLTILEWLTRKQKAVSLLMRLPELITPFGVLLIEGFSEDRDWLQFGDLAPIIAQLNPGQVHIFSVKDQFEHIPYIAGLVKDGNLSFYEESLATFLLRGEEAGYLELGKRPEENQGRSLRLEEQYFTIPTKIWTRVSRSASILDDSIFTPIAFPDKDAFYEGFRKFLSHTNTKSSWSGYEADFAFKRDFEDELAQRVDVKLNSREQQIEPIILHGQTGTGKTIALKRLAFEVRKKGLHPALYIERKSQRPLDFNSDIDTFCEWAENISIEGKSPEAAPISTLIVWDGMIEPDQYATLVQYLNGRGRKAIVVGSSYRVDEQKRKKNPKNYIEALARLNSDEIGRLTKFLDDFSPILGSMSHHLLEEQGDTSFLVALFRLLPETRALLRSGLSEEIVFSENKIRQQFRDRFQEDPLEGTIAYGLWKVGLITEDQLLSSSIKTIGGEEVDDLQELIGLVMVPGRFGVKVPIDLLLRTIGNNAILHFMDILRNVDLFRWEEDSIGNIFIMPREPLEAKIITQQSLGRIKTEIEFARQLLLAVKDVDNSPDNPEVQFAVEFIRSVGPNNEQGIGDFAPHYQELSEILSTLRMKYGVQNPRLMLQEATLLREAVIKQWVDPEEEEDLLDRAEQILRDALQLLGTDRKSNKFLRNVLLVELGSTLGARFYHNLGDGKSRSDSFSIFNEAREPLLQVLSTDSRESRSVDVLAWMTRDLLHSHVLDTNPVALAEVVADILYIFEVSNAEQVDPVQLNQRKWEIGKELGDVEMSESAFKALQEQGSCAGYYLQASHMAGILQSRRINDKLDQEKCFSAAVYLEENRQVINRDGRCLLLLLDLWWKGYTGKPIFSSEERQVLPFDEWDWKYCLYILEDLQVIGNNLYMAPRLLYLRGLATYHLGNYKKALKIFRELELVSENQGRRRIIRSYLASDEKGAPKKYDGQVERVEGNKGMVYVPEIRDSIPFFVRDFNRPNIQKGETLSNFHIGFNFIGPIADPESFFEHQEQRRNRE